MLHSDDSNRTFRLQNTVYKLQSIKPRAIFKQEHCGKVNTHTSCVSIKLQMNYKKRFYKTVIKHFYKKF